MYVNNLLTSPLLEEIVPRRRKRFPSAKGENPLSFFLFRHAGEGGHPG